MVRYIGSFLLLCSTLWSGQGYALHPPGTVKIKLNRDVVYVDRSNVSQTDWLEYVAWRNKWDSTFVMSPLDSAVRRQIYTKALRDTPVTGLTREQADGYCLWRTKMVNEHSRFAKAKKEVCYTLPAEAQCQLLSQKRKWRKHNIESDPFPTKGFRCIAVMSKRK